MAKDTEQPLPPQPWPNAGGTPDLGPLPPEERARRRAATPPPAPSKEQSVKKTKRDSRKQRLRDLHKQDGRYIPRKGWARLRYRFVFWVHLWVIRLTFLKPGRYPRPYIPVPGLSERALLAVRTTKNARFDACKFVAVFNLQGGVGKSTLAVMLAKLWKRTRIEMAVLVQDCNRDRGTTADRITRTVKFAVRDLIANLRYVKTLADFTRYCSEDDGVYVLAGTRAEDYEGIERVDKQSWADLHQREARLVNFVVDDCGTSTDSPSNTQALYRSDVIIVPFSPTEVGIRQAKATFAYLLAEQPRKACRSIFVANRFFAFPGMSRRKLQKIRNQFELGDPDRNEKGFGEDFQQVTLMPMGISLSLFLGLRVNLAAIRRRVLVQMYEIVATIADRLADSKVDDEGSQKTHEELAQEGKIPVIPQENNESHDEEQVPEMGLTHINGSPTPLAVAPATA